MIAVRSAICIPLAFGSGHKHGIPQVDENRQFVQPFPESEFEGHIPVQLKRDQTQWNIFHRVGDFDIFKTNSTRNCFDAVAGEIKEVWRGVINLGREPSKRPT